MTQAFQLAAQLVIVIDFAVENQNDVAVVADHRLIAVGEIHDLQPNRAQRHATRLPGPLLIGTSMSQRARDLLDPLAIRLRPEVCKSCNSAQGTKSCDALSIPLEDVATVTKNDIGR